MTIYDRSDPNTPDDEPEPEELAAEPTPDADADREAEAFAEADVDEADAPTAEAAPRDTGNSWSIKLLALPVLLALAVPTIFLGLGRTSLWEPDEPAFAEASRQMLASGDYLTPYFNGEATLDQPALFYWLQAATFRQLGVSEYAARMPAGLAGLGCLVLVYVIGLRLFSARAGLLAAVALGTTFRFVVLTRTGLPDTALLFFTLAALYAFIRAADADPPGSWIALLGWVAVALGVLTKGPVGLLPLLIWLPWLVLSGRLGGLRRMRFATGVLLMLIIAAPWYFYMAWTHGREFVEVALLSELMLRYASAPGVERGPLFYLAVWPADAMPWTLYIVGAVASVVFGWGGLSSDQRGGASLCVIWIGAVIALGLVSADRLPQYLLPLYPAGALLVGMLFDRAAADAGEAGPWTGLANWLTALGLLALGGLSGWLLQRLFGTPLMSVAMALPAALVLGAIFMVIFQRSGRPLWAFGVVAPVLALGYGLLAVEVVPRDLERFKPIRPLAEIAAAQPGADRQIGLYRDRSQGVVFYARQNVERLATADDAAAFLSEDGVRLCILPDGDLEDVRSRYSGTLYRLVSEQRLRVRFADLLRDDVERATLVLVSNRPPE